MQLFEHNLIRLEQQNYLKIGSLSANLCSQIEHLSQQVNSMLSDSNMGISERTLSIKSLRALREQQFNALQTESVQTILAVEKQHAAALEFYQILQTYKGGSFAQITESDRVRLRTLYPKIQMALAHNNLDLENQLAATLNKNYVPESKAWWQKTVGFVSNYVMGAEIDKVIETKKAVDQLTLRRSN